MDVLHEFNSENTIKAILVDNTNANTGCEGGMVAILEKIFKNLHTIGFSLHHNEIPFRALFKNINGCAKAPTAFRGNYAQRIAMIYSKYNFPLLAVLWIHF